MSLIESALGINLDGITGVEGTAGYVLIFFLVFLGYFMLYPSSSRSDADKDNINGDSVDDDDDEPEPKRNFTKKQLSHFDGRKDDDDENKPVYLSVNGIVFDVSGGRDFYGPEGPYEKFAGRECGVALAKMSFDEQFLDDVEGCDKLPAADKAELENWIEKFTYYRNYPIMGRLISEQQLPNPDRILSKQDLEDNNGSGPTPEGYAASPIYVGVGHNVYDCSFGGVAFYGPGGGYNRFAGKDVSRALAKMSFDPEDIESHDLSDLTDRQKSTLSDWIKTYENKKGYPVVGKLQK